MSKDVRSLEPLDENQIKFGTIIAREISTKFEGFFESHGGEFVSVDIFRNYCKQLLDSVFAGFEADCSFDCDLAPVKKILSSHLEDQIKLFETFRALKEVFDQPFDTLSKILRKEE